MNQQQNPSTPSRPLRKNRSASPSTGKHESSAGLFGSYSGFKREYPLESKYQGPGPYLNENLTKKERVLVGMTQASLPKIAEFSTGTVDEYTDFSKR
jgi:hypothetical protein